MALNIYEEYINIYVFLQVPVLQKIRYKKFIYLKLKLYINFKYFDINTEIAYLHANRNELIFMSIFSKYKHDHQINSLNLKC